MLKWFLLFLIMPISAIAVSENRAVGDFLVGFGHNSSVEKTPIEFNFSIKNRDGSSADFTRVDISIKSRDQIVFMGNLARKSQDGGTFVWVFPSAGTYEFELEAINRSSKIVKNKFEIKVGREKVVRDLFAKRNKNALDYAISARSACLDTGEFRDYIDCYSAEFYKISKQNGQEFAFRVLFELQSIDSRAQNCHLIAHGIGWGAYDNSPSVFLDTISSIPLSCNYGAIHGVLEKYMENGGIFDKSTITTFCSKRTSPGCIHAVGHLTTVKAADDLDYSIEMCSGFSADSERFNCLSGMFMEHMIAQNLMQHGLVPEERRTYWYRNFPEFEKLCRSYDGIEARACWTEIVHAASINFANDPKKTFDFCNTAPLQEQRNYCRRHGSTDLIAYSNFNLSEIKYMCEIPQQNDPGFRGDCYNLILGAAVSSIPLEKLDFAIDFCSSLEQPSDCFSSLGDTLAYLGYQKVQIESYCRKAGSFFDACISANATFFDPRELGAQ